MRSREAVTPSGLLLVSTLAWPERWDSDAWAVMKTWRTVYVFISITHVELRAFRSWQTTWVRISSNIILSELTFRNANARNCFRLSHMNNSRHQVLCCFNTTFHYLFPILHSVYNESRFPHLSLETKYPAAVFMVCNSWGLVSTYFHPSLQR